MNITTPTGTTGTPLQGQDRGAPVAPTSGQPDLFALTTAWLELDFPKHDGARHVRRAEPTTGGGTR
ncbi:hypothetical protein ABH926_004843 [Catenulispora sp. GP43]|uniref:hypothetical protein n=1 Tax=Catenulispora sp. GP43 TaxID=3156263 RepID=UPI0035140DD0